ncbi:carboxylesterase family protein [Gordonia pseudamarae]|uniref:carboxylesterase/lipase family protein n=1 Tax=Gordonia pseudamarae TaxID=2831662 RepID=UPI001AF639DC|nr:carboxylesterase family protein [Gordonia pseudamarae]QHN27224.1 carboxylesterase family protein [Gordonia pseudamarae]
MGSDTGAREQYPEVATAEGRVRGWWRPTTGGTGAASSAAFLGIPFAEPPVAELRFAAPVPKAPWDGVLDATAFGATPQRGDPGVTLIPEPSVPGPSTLNVNVFTPAPRRRFPGLPVLVWIHGGGYYAGSPASPWYDGRNFNRDGVVTVTISYRLGFDGFGWIQDAPSNRGVRDWLLALEWVRRNIAAFGGDPGRVTIAGQSAGGGAVTTLLGMESAQHLFHSAYCLSGAMGALPAARAQEFGRALAERGGVAPTRLGWSALPEERILELQKDQTRIGPRTLRSMRTGGLPLGPTVDGDLIRRSPLASLREDIGGDKPFVVGSADDEFTAVAARSGAVLRWIPRNLLLRTAGLSGDARTAYLAANAEVAALGKIRLTGRVLTDAVFRANVLRILEARGPGPTWTYRFSWPSGNDGLAGHCIDVPFFFDCLDGPALAPLTGGHPPRPLADEVHRAAVDFVTDGDPGWPRYEETGSPVKVFGTPSALRADDYRSVRAMLTARR